MSCCRGIPRKDHAGCASCSDEPSTPGMYRITLSGATITGTWPCGIPNEFPNCADGYQDGTYDLLQHPSFACQWYYPLGDACPGTGGSAHYWGVFAQKTSNTFTTTFFIGGSNPHTSGTGAAVYRVTDTSNVCDQSMTLDLISTFRCSGSSWPSTITAQPIHVF